MGVTCSGILRKKKNFYEKERLVKNYCFHHPLWWQKVLKAYLMLQVKCLANCQKVLGKFVSRSGKKSGKVKELFSNFL